MPPRWFCSSSVAAAAADSGESDASASGDSGCTQGARVGWGGADAKRWCGMEVGNYGNCDCCKGAPAAAVAAALTSGGSRCSWPSTRPLRVVDTTTARPSTSGQGQGAGVRGRGAGAGYRGWKAECKAGGVRRKVCACVCLKRWQAMDLKKRERTLHRPTHTFASHPRRAPLTR